MSPAKIAPVVAAMRGLLLFAVCASVAGAQNQIWIRQFGTSSPDAVYDSAPDGSGGVFVSGDTRDTLGGPYAGDRDVWIAHYDGTGGQTWIRQIGTTPFEIPRDMSPDGSGGVYVTGVTYGSLGGPYAGGGDAWIARFDSAGNQVWIEQLGSSAYDIAWGAEPDELGGVYLTGFTEGSLGGPNAGDRDIWLARYDGSGNQTWIQQFGTSSHDLAYGAAPDDIGGVYLTGYTEGSLGGPNVGDRDIWLARYDGSGNQTWIQQFGTSSSDAAVGAAPDGSGGVYVGGWTTGSLGGLIVGSYDAWLARYDRGGNQTWIRQFGVSLSDASVSEVTSDAQAGVYLSGVTSGSLAAPNAGGQDAWFARYGPGGDQIWTHQIGTTGADATFTAAPASSGAVYFAGATTGNLGGLSGGSFDAWIARYETNPNVYCTPAVPNSTGQPGRMNATGSYVVADNDFTLVASQLSLNSFGYFITSRTQGFGAGAGGGQGNICLSGDIGRFVGPGQVLNSGAAGTFSLAIDLTLIPQPFVSVAASPGETWNFQAWHRDANPTLTSNFTDAVAVTFQ